MTLAKFSLFKINKCGFYSNNGRNFEFGSLTEVLNDLKKWVDGKPLKDTKTYEPNEALNSVYLCNIHKDNHNNWLITTWNQTESTESGVTSIDGSAIVGEAGVTVSKIPEEGIPGFPTYFWVIPKDNILVSVRFEHFKTGLPEYRAYMLNYLHSFSRYSVVSQGNQNANDINLIGYRANPEDEIQASVRPIFKTETIQKPGKLDEIRSNCANITKVTTKTILRRREQVDLALWQNLIVKAGLRGKEFVNSETLIKYDIRSTITKDELDAMIKDWEKHQHLSTWYNYGFHIKGLNSPLWLGGSQARGEIELPLVWATDQVLDPSTLAQALHSARDLILITQDNE